MDQEILTQTAEEIPETPAPAAEAPAVEPGPSPQDDSDGTQARMAELEAAVGERDARLEEAEALQRELRATRQEEEGRITSLGKELQQTQELLEAAVAKYRAALLAASPDIPEELVRGQSVEEVDASLAEASHVVERIRSGLEKQAASARTPLGAPVRSAPDLSGLSAREKIAYALGQR